MATIQQKMDIFVQHPHERKKELVGIMLEELKDANDNFREIYRIFHEREDIEDDILVSIYQEVIELAEKQVNADKKTQETAFINAQNRLRAMLQQEQHQHQQDIEEADALLQQL